MIFYLQVDAAMLDFAVQKSRIAVKNPRARPPTDPRSLIHKPSVDPTPSLPVPGKVPVGVPLGGLGIGIKLPGRFDSLQHISPFFQQFLKMIYVFMFEFRDWSRFSCFKEDTTAPKTRSGNTITGNCINLMIL